MDLGHLSRVGTAPAQSGNVHDAPTQRVSARGPADLVTLVGTTHNGEILQFPYVKITFVLRTPELDGGSDEQSR
jgi:hypothetical protein